MLLQASFSTPIKATTKFQNPLFCCKTGDFPLAFPPILWYKEYLISAMNGKITAKRRKERSGHRLQAGLRRHGLVRPGAAMETWPDALRYRGSKCAPAGCEFGWYRGRTSLSSQWWDGGRFLCPLPQTIYYDKEHQHYEAATGIHSRRCAGSHRRHQ